MQLKVGTVAAALSFTLGAVAGPLGDDYVNLGGLSARSLLDSYAKNYTYTGPYTNGGTWKKGFAQAKEYLAQMTIEEKVNVTTGYSGKCVGFTGEVPRLGLSALCLQDGPLGVRPARRVSQFPAEVTVAATWDRNLISERASAMAQEFRDKGVNIWLGPVTGGPLGRSPLGGRNWEGFSVDPYLSGVASYLTVKKAQETGLLTCAKHYIAYEQETFRNRYNNTEAYSIYPAGKQDPIDSIVDDKTTHELYMWSFAEAVRAGTGAIMCSYNEVNGSHACSDNHSLNKLLKRELNYQSRVYSDWGGTWSTAKSAINGMDVTMPGSAYNQQFGSFYGDELVALVKNGSIPEDRLDDMVLRTLTPVLEYQNLTTYPQPSFDNNDTIVIMHVPGPVLVEEWIHHPNITAVLLAHLPGQESGTSLIPILWGEKSPSGKLPYTMGKKLSDWPSHTIAKDHVKHPEAHFTEKKLIDYHWFDAKRIEPRFEFGFGMSYTTFKFGDVTIEETFEADNSSIQPTAEKFDKSTGQGDSVYDTMLTITTEVTNSGDVQGAEVAQLYLSTGQPPRLLRGFDKLYLAPGETKSATFKLTRKDLSVWSVVHQRWHIPSGEFTFGVGSSSRKIKSKATKTF